MATLRQIVEKVKHRLGGSTTTASALLEVAIDTDDLTVKIDDAAGFSRGVAEIDYELVRVGGIDNAARTLQVPAYGRGYKATTAASHSAGAEVRFNPTFPNAVVADEINGVIRSFYPNLYGIGVYETTFPSDRRDAIALPATAIGVISVWVRTPDMDDWVQEDRWSFNPDSTDDDRPLRVGGNWSPSYPLRVVYAKRPVEFDVATDLDADFETVTGLPARLEELLALGVAANLAPFIEVARLPHSAAEARADTQGRPPGQALTTARYLQAEFQRRLEQEVRVLHKEHPIRVHRVR